MEATGRRTAREGGVTHRDGHRISQEDGRRIEKATGRRIAGTDHLMEAIGHPTGRAQTGRRTEVAETGHRIGKAAGRPTVVEGAVRRTAKATGRRIAREDGRRMEATGRRTARAGGVTHRDGHRISQEDGRRTAKATGHRIAGTDHLMEAIGHPTGRAETGRRTEVAENGHRIGKAGDRRRAGTGRRTEATAPRIAGRNGRPTSRGRREMIPRNGAVGAEWR
jgi:hypothetical protein